MRHARAAWHRRWKIRGGREHPESASKQLDAHTYSHSTGNPLATTGVRACADGFRG